MSTAAGPALRPPCGSNRYASGSLQFSRGCPFQCEFCDIIVIFGRVPRTKKPAQVIAELDEMRRPGFFSAMVVDDNFIGNKKHAKELLREIVVCSASTVPAAPDDRGEHQPGRRAELLELMYEANFRQVFIGIETPRAASLAETEEVPEHARRLDADKLARIQRAGLDISAGFIVGFDNDDLAIFEDQLPLHPGQRDPARDGGHARRDPEDAALRATGARGAARRGRPQLQLLPQADDARAAARRTTGTWSRPLYTPEAFFERYFSVYRTTRVRAAARGDLREGRRGKLMPTLGYGLILFWKLCGRSSRDGSLASVGAPTGAISGADNRKHRPGVIGFAQFMNRCVTHWHFYVFTARGALGPAADYNSG
jgi:hypothetical protein